jgi:hypothetical protein
MVRAGGSEGYGFVSLLKRLPQHEKYEATSKYNSVILHVLCDMSYFPLPWTY